MSLNPADRERVEDLVKPLYRGLDGADGWSRVERLQGTAARLEEGADEALVELLVLFHGVVDRLGGVKPTGRLALALRGLAEPPAETGRVLRGLARWRDSPQTPEERALHDAFLLDGSGLEATLTRLLEAGRRRVPVDRAIAALDAGPDPSRFKTVRGAELAAGRRARAVRWIERLVAEIAAERDGS